MNESVEIPEYLDTELVAAEGLADDPVFWLTHLALTMGDLPDDAEVYDVTTEAVEEMAARLSNADEPWPVFRVPFAGGHTALAVYANYEDENSVEFTVRHPDWGRLGQLGQSGPEWAGPGLSWAELTAIAAGVPGAAFGSDGLVDPAHRLLLLLPMLGDADTPGAVWSVVAQALCRGGMAEDAASRFARELFGTDDPDRADRPAKPVWTVTADSPIPVCSGRSSPRRVPIALGAISAGQAQALADALGAGDNTGDSSDSTGSSGSTDDSTNTAETRPHQP